MRREVAIVGLALAACAGLSCSSQSAERRVRDVDPPVPVVEYPTVKRPPQVVEPKGDPAVDAEIERVLKRVSEVRELAIRKPQHGRSLGRDALLVNLKQKAKEDLPPDVLRQQGEVYRALELVPLDYDFEAGLLKLLQSEIAGYHDSEDKMMYLIDDLEPDLKAITLNHELIHALHNAQGVNLRAHDYRAISAGTDNHEEARAIGIGAYAREAITDNALRAELGNRALPRRRSHAGECRL